MRTTRRSSDERVRHTPARHLTLAVGCVLAVALALASIVVSALWLGSECPGWYGSEGVIAAPESYRGRLACAADGSAATGLVFWLPSALLLVAAVVGWVARARTSLVVLTLLLGAFLPLVVSGVARTLPADCTAAQWDAHGSAGCERHLEDR